LAELQGEVDQAAFTAAEARGRPDASAVQSAAEASTPSVPTEEPASEASPSEWGERASAATDAVSPPAVGEASPTADQPSEASDAAAATLPVEVSEGPAASPAEPVEQESTDAADQPLPPIPLGDHVDPPTATVESEVDATVGVMPEATERIDQSQPQPPLLPSEPGPPVAPPSAKAGEAADAASVTVPTDEAAAEPSAASLPVLMLDNAAETSPPDAVVPIAERSEALGLPESGSDEAAPAEESLIPLDTPNLPESEPARSTEVDEPRPAPQPVVPPDEMVLFPASPFPVPFAMTPQAPRPTATESTEDDADTGMDRDTDADAPAEMTTTVPTDGAGESAATRPTADALSEARGEPTSENAVRSERDSIAVAIDEAPLFDFDEGRPLAMRGVEIRPYALYRHIVIDARDTLFGLRWDNAVLTNPVVSLRFDRRGRVRAIQVLRPTGYDAFDQRYLVSWMTRWTAAGAEIRQLGPRDLSAPFVIKLMFIPEPASTDPQARADDAGDAEGGN
ncbi:MAG: hypothetical protein ACOC0P_06025, partial [Planctomycetota bacterium]